MDLSGKRILLGLTGGIACYKSAEFARAMIREGASVQVVMTESSTEIYHTRHHAGTDRAYRLHRFLG